MRFNLLLYVPALADSLDVDYGVFIQHHLMDDRDITLDYFEFSKINPENYALDIVEEKEVTKKLRKDCLVDGFTLKSYYTIDLDQDYNRSINNDEVRQIFVCFKNNSKDSLEAFVRLTEGQRVEDYQLSNGLIFFRLWASPDMNEVSAGALNLVHTKYAGTEEFHNAVEQEINDQWHAILGRKINVSTESLEVTPEAQPEAIGVPPPPPLVNIFGETGEEEEPPRIPDVEGGAHKVVRKNNEDTFIIEEQGSETFKVIAYVILALGILSIIGKFLSGS